MDATVDGQNAAILFADVKGYSVLISRDEVGTYERLRRARALFRALVGDYGGRIVDEAGDGVLAAFPDAGQAVDFALAVQRDLANAAAWQGESGPFAFRMGIHVGPVHEDGERLYGRTLIVAQRIQEVAPPGRVCISDAARAAVDGRSDLRCVSLGDRQLKNLDIMRIYRVEPSDAPILLELGPLAAQGASGATEDVSIAVLPFENLSLEPADRLLCDGITIDIIDRLSRFRDLAVIARHSAFQCRQLRHAPDEASAVLGARYLTLGTVRRTAKRLRVSAQLIEAESGQLVWSDSFDGGIADVFDVQDEIADVVAARLAHQVSAAERRRTIRTQNTLVDAYGMVLRGQDLMFQFREDANSHARHLFEEAAAVDPSYARVYSGLSRTYSEAWRCRWGDPNSAHLDEAVRLAQAAIERDEADARGFAELGYARLYRKELQDSLGAYERAIALNPNNSDVLAEMSDVLTCLGSPDRAVELMKRAFRLNPGHPDWYLCYFAEALFDLERYEEVIHSLSRMRDQTEGLKLLASSNALLGRMAEAHRFAAEIRRRQPNFSLSDWQNVPPNIESNSQQRYFEGLRLAGLG